MNEEEEKINIKRNIILKSENSLGLCDTDIDKMTTYILSEINKSKKDTQKEIITELYDSLKHDDDEDETLYLPLTKLGELKERFSIN
jgi:hypothetical protein